MDEHEGKIELPLYRKRECERDEDAPEWGVWRKQYDDHGGEG